MDKNIPLVKRMTFLLLLIVVVFLAYAISLNAPFIWDDEVMVMSNPLIQSWRNIPDIFMSSAFGQTIDKSAFYRPVQIASYIGDYHVWGLNPLGFRLTNLLIHLVSALLVFKLFRLLSLPWWGSWWVTLIWAVHPIHIESITYISGRGDALGLLWALVCINSFLLIERRPWYGVLSVIAFGLLCLTKENNIGVPLIIGVLMGIYPMLRRRWHIITGVVLNSTLLVYLGYRLIPNLGGGGTLSHIAFATGLERLYTVPYIMITYLKLMVFPYPLHMEYHYVATQLLNGYTMAFFVAIVLVVCTWRWVRHQSLAVLGLLWMMIGLGPVLQIIPLASTVREHWFYFPSIGLLCYLSSFLPKQIPFKRKYGVLLGGVVMVLVAVTVNRNQQWRDPLTLYSHDVVHEPRSFLLHNNIGVIHYRNGNNQLARQSFEKAIQTSPNQHYDVALNNLGALVEATDIMYAKQLFSQSITAGGYELAYLNLARILLTEGTISESYQLTTEALRAYPNSVKIHYFHGVAAHFLNKQQEASQMRQWLKRYAPNSAEYEHLKSL